MAEDNQDVVTKRLHISGLTQELTLDLVKKRFERIGQVVDSTLPGKNALGDDQRFAYLEVKAPKVSIKKLVNGLSGATWNNSKLRIADARPDWKQKLEKERLEATDPSPTLASEENQNSDEPEKKKKKKTKKLPKGMGIESSNISSPITKSEVKSGEEWGWNLTPAGHLIRPLVLRPDHPLPKAIPLKNDPKVSGRKDRKKEEDPKDKDEKKEKKASRKRKLDPNSKPPTRANRITLDPTRYGSQHLSGLVLDSYDPEIEQLKKEKGIWICKDEEEDGDGNQKKKIKWIHVNQDGKEGEISKEEAFDLKVRPNPKSARSELFDDLDGSVKGNSDFEIDDEEEEQESDEEENVENNEQVSEESGLEVEASKEPSYESSPSEDEEEVETEEAPQSNQVEDSIPSAPTPQSASKSKLKPSSTLEETTFKPIPFDPDSRSVFSEGYDENAQNENQNVTHSGIGPSHDFVSEREKTKNWLSSVFGEGFLEGKEDANDLSMTTTRVELVEDPEEDEEWDSTLQAQEPPSMITENFNQDQDGAQNEEIEKEVQVVEQPLTGAKARRAALLAPALKSKTQRSFQPHTRFDPGTASGEVEDVQMEVEENEELAPGQNEIEAGKVEGQDRKEQVQMTSLKDMFKPQEEVKGFSLLGGLDLDLDEELNFLADEPDEEDEGLYQEEINQSSIQPDSSQKPSSSSNFFLFPQFYQDGKPKDDPKNFLSILSRPMQARNDDSSHQYRGGRFERDQQSGNQTIRPQPFCRSETEEERKERWERNKKELTAEYKRRHREAVKKKRRKVEGGKAIPGRS